MPRQGKERAYGPYQHGKKYRIKYVTAGGVSETESYETEAEAIQKRDAYNQAAGSKSVAAAVADWFEVKKDVCGRDRLVAIFRLSEGDRPLTSITPAIAAKLYEQRTKECAVATHHSELGYAKRLFNMQVEAGRLRINPFADIKPVGKKNKGKPKLRVNGTRQFLAYLLKDHSKEATAVLTALTLSLRASATVNRTVADLDDDGWLLIVRNNKTAAGDLDIEVPAFLRERLMKLAEGKAPHERLFGDMTRFTLHYHTVRLCKAAGVDRVSPHGLRGSGATMAVRAGQAIEAVAKQIGHADGGVTLKGHYLGGGAIESGRARAIEGILVTERSGSVTNQENTEVN